MNASEQLLDLFETGKWESEHPLRIQGKINNIGSSTTDLEVLEKISKSASEAGFIVSDLDREIAYHRARRNNQ